MDVSYVSFMLAYVDYFLMQLHFLIVFHIANFHIETWRFIEPDELFLNTLNL